MDGDCSANYMNFEKFGRYNGIALEICGEINLAWKREAGNFVSERLYSFL